MIIITAVYVIATILICVFNYKSAKAAYTQILINKKQYEDDKLLKLMPCLLVKQIENISNETINGKTKCYFDVYDNNDELLSQSIYIKIYNIGHDIAKEISYEWNNISLSVPNYNIISLPVNDCRIVNVEFFAKKETFINYKEVSLNIYYSDLFDHRFCQEKCVSFLKVRL